MSSLAPDEYVQYIVDKYTPQTGPGSPAANAADQLYPVIKNWAGAYLLNVFYSGSYAKGTGVKGESDLDLFISLDSSSDTLGNNYFDLYSFLQRQGYYPEQQNVSIGLTFQNLHVDLIPARKLPGNTNDHYLFVRKADSWKKTNVAIHIDKVKNSGRTREIRAIKIWRKLRGLKFPSIYLELTVIDALYGRSTSQLADNVLAVLSYLKYNFVNARVDDPANTNNVISDELESYEKNTISNAAASALSSTNWNQIILVKGVAKKKQNTVNLHNLFSGVQSIMEAALRTQENVEHPVTHGDSTELNWSGLLETYLPKRYKVDRAQVLDSKGELSESVDIVIYDRQYSPNLFSLNKSLYVPAESVYAVIEVKPELNKKYLTYAGEKAASVRKLHRTSAPIWHAGGKYKARKPLRIISGIVAQKSRWKPAYGRSFTSVLASLDKQEQIDFGCVLDSGAFEVKYDKSGKPTVRTSECNDSLITFLFDLLSALQKLGTAPAIEFSAYKKSLQD